ncbi:hypothetical protein JF66_15415 [Cryobacterium sp. MLB-32]|uniref:hypothetical protein n=1 Tax=Cryobacterium sp. MLB-32 TaxID=1529318 RepID=UPI0004E74D39|nr:hypothetical protein [Cryobacterium sp. MLB-32]KFF58858.1 hypothetical protein JF66_15415 [Cryobacterium sp. MLB-32]
MTSRFRRPSVRTVVILSSVAGGVLLGVGAFALTAPATEAANDSRAGAAVQTSFPGLQAPDSEPQLAGLDGLHPAAGQVVWVSGPFDDRFSLDDTSFDGTAVTGNVRVTSDVSAVLELEVVAGFYDVGGDFLGTARFVHHLVETDAGQESIPEERITFAVTVPAAFAGRAAAAAVGVPVLVNE